MEKGSPTGWHISQNVFHEPSCEWSGRSQIIFFSNTTREDGLEVDLENSLDNKSFEGSFESYQDLRSPMTKYLLV